MARSEGGIVWGGEAEVGQRWDGNERWLVFAAWCVGKGVSCWVSYLFEEKISRKRPKKENYSTSHKHRRNQTKVPACVFTGAAHETIHVAGAYWLVSVRLESDWRIIGKFESDENWIRQKLTKVKGSEIPQFTKNHHIKIEYGPGLQCNRCLLKSQAKLEQFLSGPRNSPPPHGSDSTEHVDAGADGVSNSQKVLPAQKAATPQARTPPKPLPTQQELNRITRPQHLDHRNLPNPEKSERQRHPKSPPIIQNGALQGSRSHEQRGAKSEGQLVRREGLHEDYLPKAKRNGLPTTKSPHRLPNRKQPIIWRIQRAA